MAVTYSLNQATPLAIKGQPSSGYTLSTLEAAINPSTSSTIVGGTALKIIGSAGNQPLVDKAAATDLIVGFLKFNPVYNGGDATVMAGDQVTMLVNGSTMVMEVGATAITAGNKLEIVATGDLVIPSLGTNKVIGTALASGVTGDLIPVRIQISAPAAV
jgi:hypothetical protein